MKGGNLGTQRSRTISDAFPDGWGKIPDDPVVAASAAALFRGGSGARWLTGGWSPDHADRLAFRHIGRDDGGIVVSLDPDAVPAGEGGIGLARQWSIVEGITPLTIDVLLAVLAQICASGTGNESKHAWRMPVPVTARAILRYKGLQRWGAEGAALRRRVDQEIVRLRGLRFDVRRNPVEEAGRGRWNGHGVSVDGDRLFDIVDSTIVRPIHRGSGAGTETVWMIQAGRWAQRSMHCRAEVRYAALPQLILQLDHRRNRGSEVLAKKISLDTMVLQGPPQRRIGDLLADIGELPRRDARGGRWGGRMRDRFEEAILMLQEAGMFGVVEWPAGYGPDSADRTKGWVKPWLTSKVGFVRPEVTGGRGTDAVTRFRKQRQARKAACEPIELRRGSVIRAMRTDRNIPQCRLARELGISAAYLSQIENDRRMASQAVLERIAGWQCENGEADRNSGHTPGAVAALEGVTRWGHAGAGRMQREAGSRFSEIPATGTPIGKDDRT